MGSSGDSIAQAWAQCVQDYGRCADACEAALDRLRAVPGADGGLRSELIVCAAVARVAARALEQETAVAAALVEYSVDVCRRCGERLLEGGVPDEDELPAVCAAAAESAATLLLVS